MVNEYFRGSRPIYFCEVCGHGYGKLAIAEQCEVFCDTHGAVSPDLIRKAVYKPPVALLSVA